jgi:SAM-dependent methyltransferase
VRNAELNQSYGDLSGLKRALLPVYEEILRDVPAHGVDEQGLPSYVHPNVAMRWLFWKRIGYVMRFLDQFPDLGACLDFGCGSGVMLPYLNARSSRVVACDVDLAVARAIVERFRLTHVSLVESLDIVTGAAAAPACGFQVILALDVLEHVDDLEGCADRLAGLLQPGGWLVVSGPTENWLYRLGRRLAGFRNTFHVRTVYDVLTTLGTRLAVRDLATLYYPLPLFKIYGASRLAQRD